MIIVSSCLAGKPCRYDGTAKTNENVLQLVRDGLALPVCAEELGGLETPRKPCEIVGGDGADVLDGKASVQTCDGEDKTAEFLTGANAVLEAAKKVNADYAILKSKSPSCGCGKIYDGSFSGGLRSGCGVTAALLERNGIRVQTEE